MKRLLLALSVVAALVSACKTAEQEKPEQKYGKIAIFWGDDSYSAEPGQTVALPFTINGTQGVAVDVAASVSDPEYDCKLKLNADYTGTVNLTVPEIVKDAKQVDVTLKVDDDTYDRHASLAVPVKVSASKPLTVSLATEIKTMATKPGKSFDLPFKVDGLAPAVKSDITYEITSGWTVATKSWDDASASGICTVTAPAALTSEIDLKINFKDNKQRTATGSFKIAIVEIVVTEGAANCHIAAPGSVVAINAVKGNSATKVDFNSACLLWQDALGMVQSVAGNGTEGVIVVTLNKGISGNAVVAAKLGDEITWSWHIWVTDYDPAADPFVWTNTSNGVTYTYMDRNLGAMGCAKDSKLALGLLYQWGRKDPFTGASDVESNVEVSQYDINGKVLHVESQERPTYGTDYTKTNLEFAIANPMLFLTAPSSSWPTQDWLTDKSSLQNNDLWGGRSNAKSIYDPCPEGWWVPADDEGWDFRKEYKKAGKLNDDAPYDESYAWYIDYDKSLGFRYRTSSGKEYWFPFVGNRNCMTGVLQSAGGSGYYHTRSDNSNTVVVLNLAWGNPASTTGLNRPYGCAVRCIKQ